MRNEIEYVIEPQKRKLLDFREIWRYKELFYFFAWRDIKVKYKQTFLGIFWVLIQPVVTVLIFSVFFGRALQVPSLDLPYPLFVFSGLLFWTFFSTGVSNASNSIIAHSSIIKKIYFPRLVIPLSAILVLLVDFFIAFILFIAMMIFYKVSVPLDKIFLLWPVAVALLLIATAGMSCLLAALSVKYRDFRHIIPFALQVTLFLTPVIYPTTVIAHDWIKNILALNPVYAPIMLFKMSLTNTPIDMSLVAISVTSSLVFLLLGIYYFKRTENYFADIA
jgi:lipopolysaccharide transport system permease protein